MFGDIWSRIVPFLAFTMKIAQECRTHQEVVYNIKQKTSTYIARLGTPVMTLHNSYIIFPNQPNSSQFKKKMWASILRYRWGASYFSSCIKRWPVSHVDFHGKYRTLCELEHGHRNRSLTHWTWSFSIVKGVYQRVNAMKLCKDGIILDNILLVANYKFIIPIYAKWNLHFPYLIPWLYHAQISGFPPPMFMNTFGLHPRMRFKGKPAGHHPPNYNSASLQFSHYHRNGSYQSYPFSLMISHSTWWFSTATLLRGQGLFISLCHWGDDPR